MDSATVDPRRPPPVQSPQDPVDSAAPAVDETPSTSTLSDPTLSTAAASASPTPTPTLAVSAAMDASIAATLAAADVTDGDLVGAGRMPLSSTSPSAHSGLASRGEGTPVVEVQSEGSSRAGTLPPSMSPVPAPTRSSAPTPDAVAVGARKAPLSRVAQLNARIERDPLDGEARLALIADAVQKGDLERTREVYEEFLKVFPDASAQWIAYVDLELSHSFFPRVEALFARCLRPSPSVDLWKFYLDYIRRVNPVDPSLGDRAKDARGVIGKSFEFALAHVGMDRLAGDMWMEYIAFLKEGQNRGTWEDQQRMDTSRTAYQRAVQIPLNNVEQIWQDYNQFENTMNKMTAKKFVSELSPAYMTARKALREMRAMYDKLSSPSIPQRPDWSSSSQDREHLALWKKYLKWEEDNPCDIEDAGALQGRIASAYKKAVASMRFYSEMWYLTANYNLKLGQIDEAITILQSGMTAIPSSLLLSYTLAELMEGKSEFPACYKIYDDLIVHFHARVAALEAATEQDINEAMTAIDAAAEDESSRDDAMGNAEEAEGRQKTVQEKEEVKAEIRKKREPEIEEGRRAAANVWITEMRFARRAEGIKQARSVFTKARKSPHLAWQVYEASATMELLWNQEMKIATNIFELGLKQFSTEPDYILQYLDFLIRSNNPNNARALFERTVALVEPSKVKAVWDRMSQYEYQYGDYLAAQKIFQRYSEAFPEASPTERFAQRHGYIGLDSVIKEDLGTVIGSSRPSRGERRSRSPSPRPSTKRGPSVEPHSNVDNDRPSFGGPPTGPDVKRMKQFHEGSPAPSSNGGGGDRGPSGWNRGGGRDERDDFDHGRGGGGGGGGGGGAPIERRRPIENVPQGPRVVPYALDPRGDVTAVLPDAVVFFLSILPGVSSFNGPILNAAQIVDIIGSTMLPGTAPGPGLPGERLGIPPRPKPQQQGGYRGESPPRGGQRDSRDREPEYGYGARRGPPGGGGGGGGPRSRY